jgi:hypothetical protein
MIKNISIVMLLTIGINCMYANSNLKSFDTKNIYFFGKWVAKGGNPYLNVYTFNEDGTFNYQYDDSGIAGDFIYESEIITFYVRERYLSDETQTSNEEFSYKIIKVNSSMIQINNTLYKNINNITEEDNWYGDGISE